MEEYAIELETQWHLFKAVLIKYPKIFDQKYIDRGLWYNVYAQICTRCFGFGLPSTGMIPMIDNLNHTSCEITNEVINCDLHLKGPNDNRNYYRAQKHMNDYSAIFASRGYEITDETRGRYKRDVFHKIKNTLS